MPDGLVIPLEVTSSVDAVLRSANAALERKGRFVPRSHCRNDWVVFPGRAARINKIRELVDLMLAAIENEGIEEFFSPAHAGDSRAVFGIFSELGIVFGSRSALKRSGILICSPSGDAVEVTADSVQEAVTAEATKGDNRVKLGAVAAAEERHLFVLISGENQKPWFGLVNCDPPIVAPDLPAEITHVWAAARGRGQDEYVVWLGKADGWTNLGLFHISQ